MKTFLTATACVLIFFTAASTGHAGKKTRKNDKVRKNELYVSHIVRQIEEIANAFETVRNKKSARLAARRIDKNLDKLLKLNSAQGSIPKLSSKQTRALEKKITPRLNAAIKRMKSSAEKAGKKSGGEKNFVKTMQRMIAVGNKLQTSRMRSFNSLKKKTARNKKQLTNRGSSTRRKLKSRKVRKHKRYHQKKVRKHHKNPTRKKHSSLTH